jgi:hypothetical protein
MEGRLNNLRLRRGSLNNNRILYELKSTRCIMSMRYHLLSLYVPLYKLISMFYPLPAAHIDILVSVRHYFTVFLFSKRGICPLMQ